MEKCGSSVVVVCLRGFGIRNTHKYCQFKSMAVACKILRQLLRSFRRIINASTQYTIFIQTDITHSLGCSVFFYFSLFTSTRLNAMNVCAVLATLLRHDLIGK